MDSQKGNYFVLVFGVVPLTKYRKTKNGSKY